MPYKIERIFKFKVWFEFLYSKYRPYTIKYKIHFLYFNICTQIFSKNYLNLTTSLEFLSLPLQTWINDHNLTPQTEAKLEKRWGKVLCMEWEWRLYDDQNDQSKIYSKLSFHLIGFIQSNGVFGLLYYVEMWRKAYMCVKWPLKNTLVSRLCQSPIRK